MWKFILNFDECREPKNSFEIVTMQWGGIMAIWGYSYDSLLFSCILIAIVSINLKLRIARNLLSIYFGNFQFSWEQIVSYCLEKILGMGMRRYYSSLNEWMRDKSSTHISHLASLRYVHMPNNDTWDIMYTHSIVHMIRWFFLPISTTEREEKGEEKHQNLMDVKGAQASAKVKPARIEGKMWNCNDLRH